jgi:protein-S-isoprenylcysteine O-methyltransferase Ste14
VANDPASRTRGPLPPALLSTGLALMVGLHLLVPVARFGALPWRLAAAAVFLVVGATLNLWADGQLKRLGTTVKPFEETEVLVETGAFGLSRHPMYLGMVLVLAGTAIAFGSLSPWLVVPVFVWQVRSRFIEAEERKLEETFGARYQEYRSRVRRWL